MSRKTYDPVKMGLAAGSSADPLQLGLSDKAAKDYSQAMKSIEQTSKMGGWNAMMQMAQRLIDMSENPMVQVFMKFMEYMSTRINAEFAEAAARLAETLFSDRSIEQMDKMADSAGKVADAIIVVNDAFYVLDSALSKISDGRLDAFSGGLDYLAALIEQINLRIGWLTENFDSLGGSLLGLLYIIEQIEEALDDLNVEL